MSVRWKRMNIFVISCMYSLYLTINAMHVEHILGDTVTKKNTPGVDQ